MKDGDNAGGNSFGEAGFTLIELIVTMMIISIVVAAALYNFAGDRPGKHARAAAREVYGKIQAYRMEALSKNTNYRLSFTEEGSTYTVEQVSSAGTVISTVETGDLQDEHPDIVFDCLDGTAPDGQAISSNNPVNFANDRFTILVNGRFNQSGFLLVSPAASLGPGDTLPRHQNLIVVNLVGHVKMYKYAGGNWR